MPTFQRSDPAGFALIDLLFVVALIGVIASIGMPGLVRARASAGAASVIGDLRVINSAQISYAITCGSGFYAPNLTTLGTVPPGAVTGFISPDLGTANVINKGQYRLEVTGAPVAGSPGSCNGLAVGQGAAGYRAGADSLDPVLNRFFATNASGTIYQANVSVFAVMPEVGAPPVGVPIY